jgi:allophanate hydrolase
MALDHLGLAFDSLRQAYRAGTSPHDVVDEVLARIERDRDRVKHAWLHVASASELHASVDRAIARRDAGQSAPLFGIPFAVKDNIDVAGVPTTVACPDLAYVPAASALVVQRLVDAGAIFVGKVNLDQLATGLVGARSPYGTPTNPFDARMIPGGSSSGSGVTVAVGHVSFALGTDTAGSGRVPAGFNNIVGLKPTRGALSIRGVVPACRSFDCVTVFALTVEDACAVASAGKQWDALDPFSRIDAQSIVFEAAKDAPAVGAKDARRPWRIGVPSKEHLVFFDDEKARAMFDQATQRLREMGVDLVEVDLRPFRKAGEMLYGSACVAERLVAGGDLLERNPEALVPVVRDILADAKRFSAREVFEASYTLASLRQTLEAVWRTIDALVVPTTPTIYRVDEVLANPRALNSNLGVYTTFGNLLDLAAIAVPSGFRSDGLPSGIQVIGPRGTDGTLAAIASAYHAEVGGTMGATGHPLVPVAATTAPGDLTPRASRHAVVVVGAHLSGQPLNHQLVGLGGSLVMACKTAPAYRLYALKGTVPPKPGLVRVRENGRALEVEVWSLDTAAFGAFVGAIPRPLCIGSIELDNGTFAQGFLCEPDAIADATDISHHGGWLAYLRATKT